MAPHIANFLLGSFGIVAAILLIGGSIVLKAQRNRQRFELARRAIESGAPLPSGPPTWLASRRQALSILACGVALLIVGAAAWRIGATAGPFPVPQIVYPDDYRGERRPPGPSPAMEAWHSAQERVAVGQTAIGCGVILTLLGVVRLAYTRTEKRFAETHPLE